jgi:transcriptional regulator with XRE-family HTH domain
MLAFHELAAAVRARREEIGLTQAGLAKLSGLSQATVENVEAGAIEDLGLRQTAALLAPLRLSLFVTPPHPNVRPPKQWDGRTSLDVAGRTASTSYRSLLPAAAVGEALPTGIVPDGFEPHMQVFLDESPLSLLAKAVEQVHLDSAMPLAVLWANMRTIAVAL